MHKANNKKISYEKYERKKILLFFVPQQTDINLHEHCKKQQNYIAERCAYFFILKQKQICTYTLENKNERDVCFSIYL